MFRTRLAWLTVLLLAAAGQAATVDSILANSRKTLTGVDSFTCTLRFNLRSTSVRVPDSRARISFKLPDKFKAEPLDGDYAVLPSSWRFALGNALTRLAESCRLRLLRSEALGGRNQYVLRADEKDADLKGVYHILWVDAERYTVSALRTYQPDQQPVTMTMGYTRSNQAWLPNVVKIEAQFRNDNDQNEKLTADLSLTDYRVNVGLKDSDFDEQPRK